MGKLSLLLIEAEERVHAQFECRSYVQQIGCAGTELSGCLPGQLACPLKKTLLQPPELENTATQVLLEIAY